MARRIVEVVIAAVGGAGLVAVAIALNGSDPDQEPLATTTTVTIVSPPSNPAPFVAAYERSLTGTYLTRGTFSAHRDGTLVETATYKRVRMNGQVFEQEGDSILKVDGPEHQLCFQPLGDTTITCDAPGPTPSLDETMAPVRQRVTPQPGATVADYEVRSESDGCWLVTSTKTVSLSDWGESSTWCFDEATGALVYQEIINGTRLTIRESTLVVDNVTIEDFAPDQS